MNTKHILGSMLTATMAFVAPAYAGILGGGGSVGGGLGGGLGGFGGHALSGTGNFGSQGSLSGTLPTANAKPVAKKVGNVDDKVVATGQTAKDKAESIASAANSKLTSADDNAADAVSSVGVKANDTVSNTAAKATAASVSQGTTPNAMSVSPTTPAQTTMPQTGALGSHMLTGNGALDVQHAKGSNSLAGDGSATLN